jgi:hypothetical protein
MSPKFKTGDQVWKIGGDYGGPGIVRGRFFNGAGQERFVVAHKIDGGFGQFLHIYSERNLVLASEVLHLHEETDTEAPEPSRDGVAADKD